MPSSSAAAQKGSDGGGRMIFEKPEPSRRQSTKAAVLEHRRKVNSHRIRLRREPAASAVLPSKPGSSQST